MSRYDWPRHARQRAANGSEKDDAGGRAEHNARRRSALGDHQARLLLRRVQPAIATARGGTGVGARPARAVASSDTLLWQPLGPSTILGGQAEGNPRVSGRINALCVHPDGQRAYAASANGGVWATVDGGHHWTSVAGLASTNLAGIKRPAHRNVCAALHVIWRDPPTGTPPAGNEIVFMGTGEPHLARKGLPGHGEDGLGIFVAERPLSNPADDPWQREAVNLVNDIVYAITSSPDGNTIVAATRSGLFQRPAAAAAEAPWTMVAGTPFSTGPLVCTDVCWTRGDPDDGSPVAQRRPERLWAWVQGSASKGLWVRDAGQTDFSPVTVDMANSAYDFPVQRAAMAALPLPQFVWLLIDRGGGNTGLFRVSNPKPADGPPKARAVDGVPDIFHDTGWYNLAIAVDPGNESRVALAGNYLGDSSVAADIDLVTTADGATRGYDAAILIDSVVPNPINAARLLYGTAARADKMIGIGVHPDVHALTFSNGGASLWTGCDGGVYRSDRPLRPAGFYAVNDGLSISETNFLGASAEFEGDLMVGLQDNGVAVRLSGSVWQVVYKGDGGGIAREPHRPARWLAQYLRGKWSDPSAFGRSGPLRRASGFYSDESNDSAFYTLPGAIGHSRGGNPMAQLLIGTRRVWYTDDTGVNWATLPTGTDAESTVGGVTTMNAAQDDLGSPVHACRWQDPDTAWALTEDAVYKLQRSAGSHEGGGAGNWTQPALKVLDKNAPATSSAGKAKKRSAPAATDPLALLRSSPTWTEIEPNFVPAQGATPARPALYLGTIGNDSSAAGVDTLWWFDGVNSWVPTELATRGNGGSPLPAPVTAILIDPALPDEVWVGTSVGVVHGVRSAVAAPPPGSSGWHWDWSPRLNGLPEAPVEDLALYKDGSLRLLRAAIGARGVWELRLDQPVVPSLSYLRVHEGDLRHRTPARLLEADGSTERPWHASPDLRPRLAPSSSVAAPGATALTRLAHGSGLVDEERLRRFQAALRSSKNDPRIIANGQWDGYFSEVLRDHGAPTVAVPAPPLPDRNQVRITTAFWNSNFVGAHRTAEPWGGGIPTHADLLELTPKLPEGTAGEAACTLAARPWKVEVVVHHRGRTPRNGDQVRVSLLWFTDPASKNRMAFDQPARWAAIPGDWTAAVQTMMNNADGKGAALPSGWSYVLGSAGTSRRISLDGQLIDPLNAGVARFNLNLTGLRPDRLVLLVAVVRAGADLVLANAPLRDLVLGNPAVAVRAVRIA